MSTTASTFTGQSSFSTDLQNVITRAVGIASLPITQLQNLQSKLTDQQSELQTVGNGFAAINTALTSLNSASGYSSYTAAVDVPAVANASVTAGALAGSYALNVTSIGSQTNTISSAGSTKVTDPSSQSVSSATTFSLSVDGANYSITPASNSLNDLVKAINTSGAKVQATLVNVGGSSAPDYRISVQSTQYSPSAIQLNDGTNNLLNTLSTGTYVTYQVNGQPTTPINATSRSLSISTGLTVNVTQTGAANITVAQNTNAVSSGLSDFITAYNSAVDELTKNRGQNGGALAGQSIVSQLSASLQSLAGYSSSTSGSVTSLTDLGISFDDKGHLSLDSAAFNAASAASPSDVFSFLGSTTSGGFLNAASTLLSSLTDSSTGLVSEASQNIGTSILDLTSKISAKQDQITQLQTNLTAQISKADAAISSLQQQVTQITNLFAAMTQASKNITG